MAESSLLRRDAQKAYEKKDYKGALAALEKILASGPSNDELLATLDLRVSIYMKLDDKVSARKDATQMIRTNRADGRGYLRLGQLERLTDDHAAAIKWYEHGLKKVAERDRLHAYITAQHVKTTAMLKAKTVVSKPADPFAKLPAEIIEMIVRFFNYREAVICLRVSKTWRQVLHTYSTLRNTLDFSHVGKGKLVTFAGIKAALRRSQKAERPILVVAKDFTQPAARYLKKTMERWIHYTKMQHFEVDCPGDTTIDFQSLQWHQFQLRTVVFGSQHKISLDTVYKILQSCEALQKAVFLSVWPSSSNKEVDPWVQSTVVSRPNLVLLTIERAHAMGRQPLSLVMPAKFFERFAELEHLTLKNAWPNLDAGPPVALDFSSLKSLRSFDCSRSRFSTWPALPVSLEVLDCTECWVDDYSNPNVVPFGNLHIARLARCTAVSRVLDSFRSSASGTLKHLDLDFNSDFWYEAGWLLFLQLLRSGDLPGLTFLRLFYALLSDEHVDILVECCRKLETVELSSPKITGVFVVGLLTAPESQLKRLVLRDCTNVSPDTYDWARQRGVIVERTTTEGNGGSGRRLRGLD